MPDSAIGALDPSDLGGARAKRPARGGGRGARRGLACRARNMGFFFVARTNAQVHGAIFDTLGFEDLWAPALHQDGTPRPGAAVAELVDLS